MSLVSTFACLSCAVVQETQLPLREQGPNLQNFLKYTYENVTRELRIVRPPGTVVPGGLMFCCGFFLFFVALCGAISPRWLRRSP